VTARGTGMRFERVPVILYQKGHLPSSPSSPVAGLSRSEANEGLNDWMPAVAGSLVGLCGLVDYFEEMRVDSS
jgi:hypothetical protein